MEWTYAFYDDLDRIAAERILQRFADGVKKALRGAYMSGPFRLQSPRETARRIVESLWMEEVEKAVADNQPRFDRAFAPVIMDILKAKLKSPMYLQHGGRLIMALAPLPEEERETALRAMFAPRQQVEQLVGEGKIGKHILGLYDYVHDIRKA